RIAPAQALQQACPEVEFVHRPGADLHRFTPLLEQAMNVEFFDSGDLSGPVVATQLLPGTEAIWVDNVPAGVKRAKFSARTTLKYVADADGEHVFSLISSGVSRAWLNGELVLDAWTRWTRGQTYFTWGCDEVVHRRAMQAGDEAEIVIEYSTELPNADDRPFPALRFGAARALGEGDLDAAVEAAASADLAIVFAGLNAEWDNEGLDRPGIDLPHRQNELIARVAAANPRTVVVLQSGSPLLLPWLEQVPALLQAWYPGQECGHSIADVLLGQAEPGGRLPQTWPRRLEDAVAFGDRAQYPGVDGRVHYGEELLIGYRHHEARALAPLFEFGHGLSYTRFEMSDLRIANPAFGPGDTLRVELTLRNVGTRAGSEVVQLYVKDPSSTLARPAKELKAFAKVRLAAGESRHVTLTLGMRAFAAFDVQRRAWWAEAGEFEILLGRSSQDFALRATVQLGADWLEPLPA
ncbi:MAG: glycoside hydrolase family 3 C-terminal domain-containing protein, partial [Burkholderiales bacterium]|nr:glycoside hydrolase family 3 C-terminal domain-containing protein [Burkholderiales bacterium]